jgi:site-specific DNA-methyltransferase (adenine-specific)
MKPYFEAKGITLYQADCLEAMRLIPDASIDACITDPPYGTTACSWDSVIPFAPMWAELKRIVKKNGAIVLFGSQPFTSALVMSNPQMFGYEIIWDKVNRFTGYLDAYRKPLRRHESILVFYDSGPIYNPQMGEGKPYIARRSGEPTSVYGNYIPVDGFNNGERFPTSLISEKADLKDNVHVNQKPVELLRYLVRTYTNEGDSVLDFTCGSGTTGVACVIERRNFIGIEQDAHYCEVSAARIKRAQGVACDIPKRVKQYAPTPLFEAVA